MKPWLLILALVLSGASPASDWTFRHFATGQQAHRFMDTLPDTAVAQLTLGMIKTYENMVAPNHTQTVYRIRYEDWHQRFMKWCRCLDAHCPGQCGKLKPFFFYDGRSVNGIRLIVTYRTTDGPVPCQTPVPELLERKP